MGYTLANSSAKNTIFNNDGNAIAVQPNLKTSTLAGVKDSAIANADDYGLISSVPFVAYTGYDDTSILMGSSNIIKDVANTALQSPGADKGAREAIHKLDAVRTRRVATAIRAGTWNEFSGNFSATGGLVPPTLSNDQSALGQDDEAVVNGETRGRLNFNYHGAVTSEDYNIKTQ